MIGSRGLWTATRTSSTPLVFLCAEDDDLDLVALVHAARTHGLESEVVPGIERCDDPLVQAFRTFKHSLFVVFVSPHLPHARALEAQALFDRGRAPTQRLMLTPLDPSSPRAVLQRIRERLERTDDP